MKSIKKTFTIFAMIMIALSIVPAVYATVDNNTGGMDIASPPKNETNTNVSEGSVPAPATNSSDPAQEAIISQDNGTTFVGVSPINATTTPVNGNIISPSVSKGTYTIVPSTGPKGKISPSTQRKVPAGESITFDIIPNVGFTVADVIVDGSSVGAVSTYTFSNVNSDHTISSTFKKASGENQQLTPGFFIPVNGNGQVITANTTKFYWDGKGRVYLTGGNGYINTLADDAFDVYTDGGFLTFSAPGYKVYQGIPDITPICHTGVNTLTLKVRDIYGLTVGCRETWLYFDQRFSASFTGTPTTGTAPLMVKFTDTSTGSPTSWKWDFGDGKTSKQQNPSHKYTAAGTYTVSLTATNEGGSDTVTKAGYIAVVDFNKLIVIIKAFNTLELISDARVSLYDYVHSTGKHIEWQNITTPDGTAIFTTSGSSQQYPLVNETAYGVWVSAAGYSEVRKDVTIVSDEQRVVIKLKKNKPIPSDYTYSITFAELAGTPDSLSASINHVRTFNEALKNGAGWKLKFYHGDNNLSRSDFGINGGGLNEATFHYHIGHGIDLGNCLELPNNKRICPNDVKKKWGNKNKWVFLESCGVLNNPEWGNALDTSHGIFGYTSTVTSNGGVIRDFMKYAMDDGMPLYLAYSNATRDNLDETVTAAVIFHNEDQLYRDYLPGFGTIKPDGDPNEKPIRIIWPC